METHEVEAVLNGKPKVRFVEKGEREGEEVCMALGKNDAGRYLTVLFIYKLNKQAF